jgi:fructose-bisphosphate aldolase class 1
MRIIAELPHPDFKISILNMNQKFIVKIEQGALEQSYKIPEMDLTDGVNSVFELLDEEFLKKIGARFTEMRTDFKESYYRYNY